MGIKQKVESNSFSCHSIQKTPPPPVLSVCSILRYHQASRALDFWATDFHFTEGLYGQGNIFQKERLVTKGRKVINFVTFYFCFVAFSNICAHVIAVVYLFLILMQEHWLNSKYSKEVNFDLQLI